MTLSTPGSNGDQPKSALSPGSQSQKPRVFELISKDRKPSHLVWKDVGYSVKVATGRKEILQGVSGQLKPGELTCVLGPSGSGKTTLLNILSGRMGSGGRFAANLDGSIALNQVAIAPAQHQHLFGYVMQDDSLFATETPREIMTFAAHLRLHGVKKSELASQVDDMIQSLGLSACADTMAGNEMIKGISGGQKKRTSIGAELITNPAITFLDEPTSGLDTAAAFKVISVLKELANANQAVMCTIHQPSSEVFHLFDSAIFLARGRIVYQGPVSSIRPHFESLGSPCPPDYNPSDFVMFLVEMVDGPTFDKLVQGWQKAHHADSNALADALPNVDGLPPRAPSKGFVVQLSALILRQLRNVVRDKSALGARFGVTLFMSLLLGFIFFRIGAKDDAYDLQSHEGAITMVSINAMMTSMQPTLLTFPSERPVFLREHASKLYGVIPYFISKTIIEMVLLLIQMVFTFLIVYWLMALDGNWFVHVGATFLLGLASSSTSLLIGCSMGDAKAAMEVAPMAFVPQILFAGFFVKISSITVVLRWIQYVCALKWGIDIILLNEFDTPEQLSLGGAAMLDSNDIQSDYVWLYVIVLLGLIVLQRILAMMVLSRKARTLYG
jgi:ABC-type multidrug transport system ATPase subunit/ABC-type multidrug transport system permease subunit